MPQKVKRYVHKGKMWRQDVKANENEAIFPKVKIREFYANQWEGVEVCTPVFLLLQSECLGLDCNHDNVSKHHIWPNWERSEEDIEEREDDENYASSSESGEQKERNMW